jgi:hypothetical protein
MVLIRFDGTTLSLKLRLPSMHISGAYSRFTSVLPLPRSVIYPWRSSRFPFGFPLLREPFASVCVAVASISTDNLAALAADAFRRRWRTPGWRTGSPFPDTNGRTACRETLPLSWLVVGFGSLSPAVASPVGLALASATISRRGTRYVTFAIDSSDAWADAHTFAASGRPKAATSLPTSVPRSFPTWQTPSRNSRKSRLILQLRFISSSRM